MGKLYGETTTYSRDANFTERDEYDGTLLKYLGKAFPGSLISEAKWQISLYSYNANNDLISVLWADGTDDFIKIWDNRTNYTYK